VLAQAPDTETFITAELDLGRQDEIRRSLPSLANRRPQAYAWPQETRRAARRAGDERAARGRA
jgi:predicted amidohydrolase